MSLINLLLYPERGILRRHSVPRLLLRQFSLAPPVSVLATRNKHQLTTQCYTSTSPRYIVEKRSSFNSSHSTVPPGLQKTAGASKKLLKPFHLSHTYQNTKTRDKHRIDHPVWTARAHTSKTVSAVEKKK